MASYAEQMVRIMDRFIDEVDSDPTDLDHVFEWAMANRLYSPQPQDIKKMFKEALANSLRQEKRFDGKRWYRAKHSVRTSAGGVQLSLWADIDKNASLSFMEKSVGQRRRGMVNDAYQLKMDVDHYNEVNPDQRQLPLVLDLTDDVAEMEASDRGDDAEDDAA